MRRRQPPVQLQALGDSRIKNRDWRVFLAISFLRDPGSDTCTASLDDICRITNLPKTRVSEAGAKLAGLGYLDRTREGRGVAYTIRWTFVPGSEEQKGGESFRGAGNDGAANRSGQRGTVPGSGEQSSANRSGERGTVGGRQFRGAGNSDSSIDIQISDSDQIGSVETTEKLNNEQQAGAILRHYGIPQHFIAKDRNLLAEWVRVGRTVGQLHRAIGKAKNHNPSPGPRYVDRCLDTIALEDAGTTSASQQPWYESAPGISAKGREYGIDEDSFDTFPQFRHAVMREALRLNEPGVQEHLDRRREKVA